MRLADTRPPFAGLANLSEAALAALPTPWLCFDIEAREKPLSDTPKNVCCHFRNVA